MIVFCFLLLRCVIIGILIWLIVYYCHFWYIILILYLRTCMVYLHYLYYLKCKLSGFLFSFLGYFKPSQRVYMESLINDTRLCDFPLFLPFCKPPATVTTDWSSLCSLYLLCKMVCKGFGVCGLRPLLMGGGRTRCPIVLKQLSQLTLPHTFSYVLRYLEKQAFLQRADERQFEKEKKMREIGRKK